MDMTSSSGEGRCPAALCRDHKDNLRLLVDLDDAPAPSAKEDETLFRNRLADGKGSEHLALMNDLKFRDVQNAV
jgi:hypothetical protein